jgi:hypothetical protein
MMMMILILILMSVVVVTFVSTQSVVSLFSDL